MTPKDLEKQSKSCKWSALRARFRGLGVVGLPLSSIARQRRLVASDCIRQIQFENIPLRLKDVLANFNKWRVATIFLLQRLGR